MKNCCSGSSMENSLENTTLECLLYGRNFGATAACLCVCVCPVLTSNQPINLNQTVYENYGTGSFLFVMYAQQ